MKRFFIFLTIVFLPLIAAPSFADNYYQENSEYEQAEQRIEDYNTTVSNEYEKQMREYDRKIKTYEDLLRRVEEQYPEIRAKAADSEPSEDLQESDIQETGSGGAVDQAESAVAETESPEKTLTEGIASTSESTPENNTFKERIRRRKIAQWRKERARREKQKRIEIIKTELRKENIKRQVRVENEKAKIKKREELNRQREAEKSSRLKSQQQNRSKASSDSKQKPHLDHAKDKPKPPAQHRSNPRAPRGAAPPPRGR